MLLIYNARAPPSVLTAVMNSLVESSKDHSSPSATCIPVPSDRVDKFIFLLHVVKEERVLDEKAISDNIRVLLVGKRRLSTLLYDSALSYFVFLPSALSALDEAAIDIK